MGFIYQADTYCNACGSAHCEPGERPASAAPVEPAQLWWTSSSGKLELSLTLEQAQSMSHSGQCDADVAAGRKLPAIAAQLATWQPADVRMELAEYGAWEDAELQDHEQNLDRMLWLAAESIVDEAHTAESGQAVQA